MAVSSARRVLGLLVKLAVSALVLTLVLRRIDLTALRDRLAAPSPNHLMLALAAGLLIPVLGGLRWWVALRGLGERARPGILVEFFSVACVGGMVLPTLAADGVRLWLAIRRGIAARPVVQSIVLERVFMILALLMLALATAPILAARLGAPAPTLLSAGLLACGLVGLGVLLVADQAPRPLARLRIWQFVASHAEAARRLVLSRWGAGLLGMGLLGNLNFALVTFLLGRALGVSATAWDFLAVMPAVTLAATLPISFGGWGVREGVLVFLLGQCGVPAGQALAVSVIYGVLGLVSGLPGAAIWVASHRPAGAELSPTGSVALIPPRPGWGGRIRTSA